MNTKNHLHHFPKFQKSEEFASYVEKQRCYSARNNTRQKKGGIIPSLAINSQLEYNFYPTVSFLAPQNICGRARYFLAQILDITNEVENVRSLIIVYANTILLNTDGIGTHGNRPWTHWRCARKTYTRTQNPQLPIVLTQLSHEPRMKIVYLSQALVSRRTANEKTVVNATKKIDAKKNAGRKIQYTRTKQIARRKEK